MPDNIIDVAVGVLLRPDGGGKRFTGIIDDDGRVRLTGLTTLANGR